MQLAVVTGTLKDVDYSFTDFLEILKGEDSGLLQ